jgi:hypothetical protein
MIKTVLLSFACFAPLFAQPVSFGVEGGVPITDAFDTLRGNTAVVAPGLNAETILAGGVAAYTTNTHRYVVGPAFQIHLPLRLTFEVDALYKRLGYQYNALTPTTRTFAATVANSWEFPLLVKYEILPGPIRPFVDIGISFRHISGVKEIRQVINTTTGAIGVTTNTDPREFHKATDEGLVFGGGVAFKLGPVRIGPELRYTRWGSENFEDPVGSLLHTNKNQGDFLLGILF